MANMKMEKRKLLFYGCLLALLWPGIAFAQSDNEAKRRINEIKLDGRYVFGEASNTDENTAGNEALSDLKSAWNDTLGDKKILDLKNIQTITYSRGEKMVVFVFVPIEPLKPETTPQAEPQVRAEEVRKETPVEEAPQPVRVEEAPKPVLIQEVTKPVSAPEAAPAILGYLLDDDVVLNIMEREMVDDVWRYLDVSKEKGNVAAFGTPKSMAEIPDDAILVIYDTLYSVVAVLSPIEHGKRFNFKTQLPDEVRNYSGHGVLWLRLAQPSNPSQNQ